MKISVILTTYNVENYIEECIDSLLDQTIKNFELIIVDDGSTDNTLKILDSKYPKLNVIKNEHMGAAKCRNMGLKMARGKYICILDSDDYFEKDMLELMLNKMEKYDADVAVSSAYKFDNLTSEEVITHYMLNKDVFKNYDVFSPVDIKENIFQLTVANAWAKMFKKELIDFNNLEFQDLKNSNDVLFVFSAIINAKKIVPIDVPLVHYRFNNAKSIQGIKKQYPFEFIKAYEALQEYLITKNLYELYKQSFIKMVINIFLWNTKTADEITQKEIFKLLKEKYYEYFNIELYNDKFSKEYIKLKEKIGDL